MNFSDYPDGKKRHIVGCRLLDGAVYRVGYPAIVPAQRVVVNRQPAVYDHVAVVTGITGLGGNAGNLRICFDGKVQLHVTNAVEVWERIGDTDEQ